MRMSQDNPLDRAGLDVSLMSLLSYGAGCPVGVAFAPTATGSTIPAERKGDGAWHDGKLDAQAYQRSQHF